MNVLIKGATGNGITDDTSAIQAAVVACGQSGTVVDLYLPRGKYRITSPIKLPKNVTRLAVRGDKSQTMAPSYIDTPMDGAVIYCKEVTGPVFEMWTAVEDGYTTDTLRSFTFQSIAFDGGNGGGRLAGSTTLTGIISVRPGNTPPVAPPTMSAHFDGVHVVNIATVGAKAIDLSRLFWILVENCYIGYIVDGYGLYCNGSHISTTTLTIRKTYCHGNLESMLFGANCFGVSLESVVFESGLVAFSRFLQTVAMRDVWFEGMGQHWGTRSTAITRKDVAQVGAELVNTVMHCAGGALHLDGATMLAVVPGAPLAGWFGCTGTTDSAQSHSGSATFKACNSSPTGAIPFFAPSCAADVRGDFDITIEDDRRFSGSGESVGMIGVGSKYADARIASSGRTSVAFASGFKRASIFDGRFCYQGAAALDAPPLDGANLKGDRVRVPQPNAGEYSEYVCTADGTAQNGYVGTWKGVGLVQS